ncbi:MAG: diacylglycerol kinase family protein [Pseudomonadota bacterium]
MKFSYPIGLISNNNAKRNRKTLVDAKDLHKMMGGDSHCALRETKSLEELKDVVGEFREKKIDIILSNGGDGSHQKLISTLIYNYRDYSPYIIPLKSGTMNMLTKNLGLDISPYKAVRWLKMLLDKEAPAHVTTRGILEITTPEYEKPRYGFVFIAGCGYKLLKLYYSYPEGGKRSAARTIFTSMASWLTKDKDARSIYTYTPSKTIIDGKEFEFPYLITIASTLQSLVLGFSPFALKRSDKDGLFFMIDGEPMRKNYTLMKFFKPSDDEEWKAKRLVSKAHEFTLRVNDGFSVDGELVHLSKPADVKVAVGPRINFITPVLN